MPSGDKRPSIPIKTNWILGNGRSNLKSSNDVDALKEIKGSVARLNHMQIKDKYQKIYLKIGKLNYINALTHCAKPPKSIQNRILQEPS